MNEKGQVSLAQSVKNMRDNLPAMLEFAAITAQLVRVRYLALVKEGFTEAQALDICWRIQ